MTLDQILPKAPANQIFSSPHPTAPQSDIDQSDAPNK